MGNRVVSGALVDIVAASNRYYLVGMLGWQDVSQRYRRSALGPFWLTISMGVMICTIGVIFGRIFRSPLRDFLPYLSVGMILWGLISTVMMEGCLAFTAAEGIIKQLPIPLFVHVLRVIWRNILVFAHNIVIFPLLLLVVWKPLGLIACLSLIGFLLLVVNLTWLALFLGVVCTRYRDFPQIITSLIQILFYLTPIMWMPDLLTGRAGFYLLQCNPLYHWVTLVRAPLLGSYPSIFNWLVSLGCGLIGWTITLALYGRYRHRIAYWL